MYQWLQMPDKALHSRARQGSMHDCDSCCMVGTVIQRASYLVEVRDHVALALDGTFAQGSEHASLLL